MKHVPERHATTAPHDPPNSVLSSGKPRSADEMEREIENARARMDVTVDELKHRLSPSNLRHEAWVYTKATGRKTMNRIFNNVKAHPVPTAIAGLGIGLLGYGLVRSKLRNGREERAEAMRQDASFPPTPGYYADQYEPGRAQEQQGGRTSRAAEQIGRYASSAASTTKHGASRAVDTARTSAAHAGEWIGEHASSAAGHVSGAASSAARQARIGARKAQRSAVNTFEDHPLATSLALLGIGVAAGLALPSSRKEDQWMGSTRDDLFDSTRRYSKDVAERGTAVAEAAWTGAKHEAKQQDLDYHHIKEEARDVAKHAGDDAKMLGKDMKERTENVAQAAKESAKEEAQRQNLRKSSSPSST